MQDSKDLKEALKEVVAEIKSMDKVELLKELKKSEKSVFAQTINKLIYNGEYK